MNKPWFDPDTGTLLLDEYVAEMPSFKAILEDKVISNEEMADHAQRTVSLLRQLEEALTPETKALATQALCELAVLYALERSQMAKLR
jgi:hypothetical protein